MALLCNRLWGFRLCDVILYSGLWLRHLLFWVWAGWLIFLTCFCRSGLWLLSWLLVLRLRKILRNKMCCHILGGCFSVHFVSCMYITISWCGNTSVSVIVSVPWQVFPLIKSSPSLVVFLCTVPILLSRKYFLQTRMSEISSFSNCFPFLGIYSTYCAPSIQHEC